MMKKEASYNSWLLENVRVRFGYEVPYDYRKSLYAIILSDSFEPFLLATIYIVQNNRKRY
ncbi:hypothetical protein SAMN04488689_11710 [Paenibacillus sp. cl6col]|nr:hypothetical protein SAMN04488689_11710 [Paenibacillus sp. cl6col]